MEYIDKKYLENTFILLGKTGNGKSTACKALTGNNNIKISSSFKSCTQNIAYYPGNFGKFCFTVVDTPGLDDSDGRDYEIYQNLRGMLQTKQMKIKGLFIFCNFMGNRFGNSERKIIEKIINLVPIKKLWKYITIIVTHTFYQNNKSLEEKKNYYKKEMQQIFETEFIPQYKKKYGINGSFKDINIVFVNFDEYNPSLKEASDIKTIIEKGRKKEPLFQCTGEMYEDNVKVIEYENEKCESAILYECRIKKITYYGQDENILNEIRVIVSKNFVKKIEKSKISSKASFISMAISTGIGLIAIGGIAFPPLELAALGLMGAGLGSSFISGAVGTGLAIAKSVKDSDFKNDEINTFIDESK